MSAGLSGGPLGQTRLQPALQGFVMRFVVAFFGVESRDLARLEPCKNAPDFISHPP